MSKALLMILDGWGIGNHSKADAIYQTATPNWDKLLQDYPHSQLQASEKFQDYQKKAREENLLHAGK